MAAGYNEEIGISKEAAQTVLGHPSVEISLAFTMRASVAGRNARTRPPNEEFHLVSSQKFPRIVPSPNFCQVS